MAIHRTQAGQVVPMQSLSFCPCAAGTSLKIAHHNDAPYADRSPKDCHSADRSVPSAAKVSFLLGRKGPLEEQAEIHERDERHGDRSRSCYDAQPPLVFENRAQETQREEQASPYQNARPMHDIPGIVVGIRRRRRFQEGHTKVLGDGIQDIPIMVREVNDQQHRYDRQNGRAASVSRWLHYLTTSDRDGGRCYFSVPSEEMLAEIRSLPMMR